MSHHSWVKLNTMSTVKEDMEEPLLDVEKAKANGDADSTRSHSRSEVFVPSPGSNIELAADIASSNLSPGSTSSGGAGGDQQRRKKLVWADVYDEEREDERGMEHKAAGSNFLQFPEGHVPDPKTRPQSYILYEGRKGEGEGYIHIQRERSRSSFADNSIVSRGDITEDHMDYRTDFIKVEVPSSNPDGSSMTTAQELQICKKTVLKPFLTFLKVIGWRAFCTSRQDITRSCWIRILNIMYPTLLFVLLMLSCATQVVTCFYRDQPIQTSQPKNGVLVISCKDDLFSKLIFPDLLLLGAYLWGLYIFRLGAPEHLITLVETVFLSSQHIAKGQARMVNFMRMILLMGFIWLILNLCVSIARVFSLQLLSDHTFLYFLTRNVQNLTNTSSHSDSEQALRYSFVIFDFFGFIFFDLLYIAVIITYISQCQLVRLYIGTIMNKVHTKLYGYTLEQAMTDIHQAYKFLQIVNGKLSALTSICLLVFLEAAVSSLHAVIVLDPQNQKSLVLGAIVGVCNAVLWSIMVLVPIIQAARLTSRCQQLRRLGLSIGHRPFIYHNTPQLLLDSFVQYTNATRYRSKLAGIPIYPSFVIGGLFVLVIAGFVIVIVFPNVIHRIPWL